MKKEKVLDSFALLAYLQMEGKYKKVKDLLASDEVLFMNDINVGEAFYVLAKERGVEKAEYFVNTVLPNLPINSFPMRFRMSRGGKNQSHSFDLLCGLLCRCYSPEERCCHRHWRS